MKIVVNGSLIDLDLVYKISKIKEDKKGYLGFKFTIYFLNGHEYTLKIDSGSYHGGFDGYPIGKKTTLVEYFDSDNKKVEDYSSKLTVKELKKMPMYQKRLKEINDMRNSIIEHWSGKTKFPTYTIKRDYE